MELGHTGSHRPLAGELCRLRKRRRGLCQHHRNTGGIVYYYGDRKLGGVDAPNHGYFERAVKSSEFGVENPESGIKNSECRIRNAYSGVLIPNSGVGRSAVTTPRLF